MAKVEDIILRDTRANQPNAGSVAEGTIYFVTDEGVLERADKDNNVWESISASSGANQGTRIVIGYPSVGVADGDGGGEQGPPGRDGGAGATGATGTNGGDLILLQTLTASASASLDFASWYSSTYDDYEIHFSNIVPASNSVLYVRVSENGGSSYISTNSYTWLATGGWGTSTSYSAGEAAVNAIRAREVNTTLGTGGSYNGRLRIINPAGTSVYKIFQGELQWIDNTLGIVTASWTGIYNSTNAINALQVLMASGNITSGTVRIYGISKSVGNVGAGKIVQVVNTQTGTVSTGTTTIPLDNTIPQITEGDEYMTLAITPTSSTNKLQIDVEVEMSNSAGDRWNTVALFQDATADALKAAVVYMPTGTGGVRVTFRHTMVAGTTSSTTFRVRAGGNAAGTTTFNGFSGAQYYGGVLASGITITEYIP